MNVFDLHAWRQADITGVYHYWQKQMCGKMDMLESSFFRHAST
jgi:hypothetical protein